MSELGMSIGRGSMPAPPASDASPGALPQQAVPPALPSQLRDDLLDASPDLCERERRRIVLDDIARRIAEDGPREARPDPARAHQFKPFAALKGYGELIAQQEARAVRIEDGR